MVYDIEDNQLFYTGLTIIDGVVITDATPTVEQKLTAAATIESAYSAKQIANFVNGSLTFEWELKGDTYDKFLDMFTTASASATKRGYALVRSTQGAFYFCDDLPLEVFQKIQEQIDIPISKFNHRKKMVILKDISASTSDEELNTALAKVSEFVNPITVNLNTICDGLVASQAVSQDVKDYLLAKLDLGTYNLFTPAN
jgi:hypothetical protein